MVSSDGFSIFGAPDTDEQLHLEDIDIEEHRHGGEHERQPDAEALSGGNELADEHHVVPHGAQQQREHRHVPRVPLAATRVSELPHIRRYASKDEEGQDVAVPSNAGIQGILLSITLVT